MQTLTASGAAQREPPSTITGPGQLFSRLDKWSNLKRTDRETVAELIVREEELFTELQQSLARARLDRMSDDSWTGLSYFTIGSSR